MDVYDAAKLCLDVREILQELSDQNTFHAAVNGMQFTLSTCMMHAINSMRAAIVIYMSSKEQLCVYSSTTNMDALFVDHYIVAVLKVAGLLNSFDHYSHRTVLKSLGRELDRVVEEHGSPLVHPFFTIQKRYMELKHSWSPTLMTKPADRSVEITCTNRQVRTDSGYSASEALQQQTHNTQFPAHQRPVCVACHDEPRLAGTTSPQYGNLVRRWKAGLGKACRKAKHFSKTIYGNILERPSLGKAKGNGSGKCSGQR